MSPTRRKFLHTLGLGGLGLMTGRRVEASHLTTRSAVAYVRNEALRTILPGYAGNPIADGRFLNDGLSSSDKSFGSVFKWWMSENPQKDEKKNDLWRPAVRRIKDLSTITDDVVVWLGHAAFLIRLEGKWILTDPCLTSLPFRSRLAELPISFDQLSVVDYILISHGHYDHLDSDTISELPCRHATALVPLKMAPLVASMNRHLSTIEAGWFQEYPLNAPFRIYFLPARHWYLRVPWDRNKVLWGGFLIETDKKRIFFAGDTAYAAHFKTLAGIFNPMDVVLMPIGAYKPPFIMQSNHANPAEAVQAFNDLGGQLLIPMHYGTFDLADEPIGEPLRWLRQQHDEGRIHGRLVAPDIGEMVPI